MSTDSTVLSSLRVCQPSERNVHNKARLIPACCGACTHLLFAQIFGGFLMREACELAWANVYSVCKAVWVLGSVRDDA